MASSEEEDYLAKHHVSLYLNDALRLLVASGSTRPVGFIRDYLRRCVIYTRAQQTFLQLAVTR